MLAYLVTSKVRRRLLFLLWAERTRGSVAELAELAGAGFASVHGEVKEMQRVQLVMSQHEGGKEVYSANFDHPAAEALRALVTSHEQRTVPQSEEDQTLKRKLVALGAPLRGVEPLAVEPSEQVATLVRGASLARRDAVVARSLPLCFWKLRASLDQKTLMELAPRAEDKHALGFLLEVTSELGGDRRLLGLAENLRDCRMTLVRDFFQSPGPRRAAFRDFPLAVKWGFRMNMDLDSFRSLFDKFAVK